jgi:hypothetical protein
MRLRIVRTLNKAASVHIVDQSENTACALAAARKAMDCLKREEFVAAEVYLDSAVFYLQLATN